MRQSTTTTPLPPRSDNNSVASVNSGSAGSGTNSIARQGQNPPRRKPRSEKMKKLADSLASGGTCQSDGESLRHRGNAAKKGILRADSARKTTPRSISDENMALSDGPEPPTKLDESEVKRRHSIDFTSMIGNLHDDDEDANSSGAAAVEDSIRTADTASMLPNHWPRQGDCEYNRRGEDDMEDVELQSRNEYGDSMRSRSSRSTSSEFGLGTGSMFDKATSSGQKQLGQGGDDADRGDSDDSDDEHDDERSVATLSSVNTLLNMMQMALDEDWWKDRAQAWEQSTAKPVKAVLETEEDKAALRKTKKRFSCGSGGRCGWMANVPFSYRIIWFVLLVVTIAGTVVLTTTDWGEKVVKDMEATIVETTNKLRNGSVKGKQTVAVEGAYQDEGED